MLSQPFLLRQRARHCSPTWVDQSPPHTQTYTPPTSQPRDVFPSLKQRLKPVHRVPCKLLFTATKMIDGFKTEADYGDWRAKYVTKVSVKNVVSLWGRAAKFSANPISTGGLLGIWLPKPTWDCSYLFLLWLYTAWTKAQIHMTHDLWTLTTKTDACGCVCIHLWLSAVCV